MRKHLELAHYLLVLTMLAMVLLSIPQTVSARTAPTTSVSGDPNNDEGPKTSPVKSARALAPLDTRDANSEIVVHRWPDLGLMFRLWLWLQR